MKKSILSALAAGAFGVAGIASAQDLGTVLSNILGYGTPTYSTGIPAVVAGTYPYGTHQTYPNNTVYVDQYGRQVSIDQYGRQVLVQQQPNVYGNNVYGGVTYDQWGRPVYNGTYGNYGGNYGYRSWDRDGDGVANAQDRWPDNSRYW